MSDISLSVDWLSFTVPYDMMTALLDFLPGGIQELDRGWRGYECAGLVAGGKGLVGWSPGRPGMGCHCSLSSSALDVLFELDNRIDCVAGLVALVLHGLGGHLTRFDLAWDDRIGILDAQTIQAAVDGEIFTSRWRGWQSYRGGGKKAGWGVAFGSRTSAMYLRIYDKAAEQKLDDGSHWLRVELEAKDERATALGEIYTRVESDREAVLAELAGILRGYIEFKVPGQGDTNKTRWAPAGWWLKFLDFASKCRVSVTRKVRTVEDVVCWFECQVAPSLALVVEAWGAEDGWLWVFKQHREGRKRFSARHEAMLSVCAASA